MDHPGVWLVTRTPNCKTTTFITKKLSDLPKPNELKILTQSILLEDIIVKQFNECWNLTKSSSPADFARKVAKALAKAEIKLQNIPKIKKKTSLSIKDLR